MSRPTPGPGQTLVPAQLRHLTPALDAQALRETARTLLALADQQDGKASRVTFVAPVSGQCGVCQGFFQGALCPDCAAVRA